MSGSNYPGGFAENLTIRNVPVLNTHSTSVFWVSSNGPIYGPKGTFDKPCKTIAQALGLCTTGKGDTIFVKAYHAENLSTAAIFAMAKAGVEVIGLGDGLTKPTFTSTETAGAVMITAANCTLDNLRFVANKASVVQAIDLSAAADGTTIRNCDFRDTTYQLEFLKHIDIATTITDVVIENCTFICAAGGGSMTSSIFFTGTSQDCRILGNLFFCDCSAGVLDHLTDDATAITIMGNRMANIDTSAGLCLGLESANTDATGYIADNYVFGSKGDAQTFAITTDFVVEQNFAGNTLASSGELEPDGVSI